MDNIAIQTKQQLALHNTSRQPNGQYVSLDSLRTKLIKMDALTSLNGKHGKNMVARSAYCAGYYNAVNELLNHLDTL